MKRVLMTKTAAGPNGAFHAGATYDLPDNLADLYLQADACELTKNQPSYEGDDIPEVKDIEPEVVEQAADDALKQEETEAQEAEVAEEEEKLAEWPMKTSPEKYVQRWPDGEHAELAREIIAKG